MSDTFWKKDISNNLSFTSGKIGIGVTSPGANYSLDVLNNINCAEIYRNGTPLSSTLSLFLKNSSLYFKPPTAGERHVTCFVEKVGIEPRTLGYQALRAANCATSPV